MSLGSGPHLGGRTDHSAETEGFLSEQRVTNESEAYSPPTECSEEHEEEIDSCANRESKEEGA